MQLMAFPIRPSLTLLSRQVVHTYTNNLIVHTSRPHSAKKQPKKPHHEGKLAHI